MPKDVPAVRRRVQRARLRLTPCISVLVCLVLIRAVVPVSHRVIRRPSSGLQPVAFESIESILVRASQRLCPRSVLRASQRLCPRWVVYVLRASQRLCPRAGRAGFRRCPRPSLVIRNLLQHRVLLPQLFQLPRRVVQSALGVVEARAKPVVALLCQL